MVIVIDQRKRERERRWDVRIKSRGQNWKIWRVSQSNPKEGKIFCNSLMCVTVHCIPCYQMLNFGVVRLIFINIFGVVVVYIHWIAMWILGFWWFGHRGVLSKDLWRKPKSKWMSQILSLMLPNEEEFMQQCQIHWKQQTEGSIVLNPVDRSGQICRKGMKNKMECL